MKIIISGAGIGGLTAALCCLHFGHQVTLLEKAEALEDVGAGIQVPPNAMKVFAALGIAELLAETAVAPEALEARMGETGRRLFHAPLDGVATQRWGAPYYQLHRADYIRALQTALAAHGDTILKTNHTVTSYTQDAHGVRVHLADGNTLDGDLLIGADGIHSTIRDALITPQAPRFTGNVAWRAVVPIERLGDAAPAPTACVWMGRGRHCVTYRLRGGTLANLVAVVECADWTSESWHEQGDRDAARADFAGWHPTITQLIDQADTLYRWAICDRPPLEKWHEGRVALLGDAAHPMMPFMAQGAAMAVEDAWALAAEISRNATPMCRVPWRAIRRYATLAQQRCRLARAPMRRHFISVHGLAR